MGNLFYQIFNRKIELKGELIKEFVNEAEKLFIKFQEDRDLDNIRILKNKIEHLLDRKPKKLSKEERLEYRIVDSFLDNVEEFIEKKEAKEKEENKIRLFDVVEEEVDRHYKKCSEIKDEKKKKYRKVCVKKSKIKYEEEIIRLQLELLKLQKHIKENGEKLLIIFEGRDAAGKGGTIKRFREHINPRGARLVALEKPDDVEKTQWYFQRYINHLPAGGEMVFFDRSWYNRAGVEPVMGFVSKKSYEKFLDDVPKFEKMLVESGIKIVKFYFSVGKEQQAERFEARKYNPLKQYKLSPIDQYSQKFWKKYSLAEYNNLKHTDSKLAPWTIVNSNDKKKARVNAIKHVLSLYDYPEKNKEILEKDSDTIITVKKRLNQIEEEIDTKKDLFD